MGASTQVRKNNKIWKANIHPVRGIKNTHIINTGQKAEWETEESLIQKMTFEQEFEGEGGNHVDARGKSILGRGNHTCKGLRLEGAWYVQRITSRQWAGGMSRGEYWKTSQKVRRQAEHKGPVRRFLYSDFPKYLLGANHHAQGWGHSCSSPCTHPTFSCFPTLSWNVFPSPHLLH